MAEKTPIISIADPDNVEAAVSHLQEVLSTDHDIKGILVVLSTEDGEQNFEAFGEVRARDIAYTAVVLSTWAGTH